MHETEVSMLIKLQQDRIYIVSCYRTALYKRRLRRHMCNIPMLISESTCRWEILQDTILVKEISRETTLLIAELLLLKRELILPNSSCSIYMSMLLKFIIVGNAIHNNLSFIMAKSCHDGRETWTITYPRYEYIAQDLPY